MKTEVGNDVNLALSILKKGDVVAVPTETVYGLAAIARNENAVRKIFEIKKRPLSNPLILHVDSFDKLNRFVLNIPKIFNELALKYCPGPLTFLLDKSKNVPDIITAGSKKVAIRVPNHPLTLELIQLIGEPIAAPSANLYGQLSPTTSEHVLKQLEGRITYILEGGACSQGIESTIIGMENNEVVIYRLGIISPEDLSEVLGYLPGLKIHANELPVTSGMLPYHYSPSTSCSYLNPNQEIDLNAGYLFYTKQNSAIESRFSFYLSENGDLNEAAKNLYATLHEMDQLTLSHIYIEKVPSHGIGNAINDRISRAVAKY